MPTAFNAPLLPYPQRIELARDTLLAQPTQSRYEPGNRVLYPRVVSPLTVVPTIVADDEIILWLSEAGRLWKRSRDTHTLYHLDEGGSWTEDGTFADKSVWPVRDLPNGEVFIGLSPATDPPEFWVSSGYQTGSPTWTQVLTVDNNPDPVDGHQQVLLLEASVSKVYDNIVCVTEYDTGHAYRKAWMSQDYGNTFSLIYDGDQHGQDNSSAHIHAIAYDPWWQRIWIVRGDYLAGTPNHLITYSDDFGQTWQTMPDIGVQFLSVWPTKDFLLFGTDSVPNGIFRVWRENKYLPKFEFVYQCQPANDVDLTLEGIATFQRGDGYPVLLAFAPQGDYPAPVQVISTADGVNFTELYRDPTADPASGNIDIICGPTDSGQTFAHTTLSGANQLVTFTSLEVVDSFRPLTDRRLVRHARFRDADHQGSIRSVYNSATDDNTGDHEIVALVSFDNWFSGNWETIFARQITESDVSHLSIKLIKNSSNALEIDWNDGTSTQTSGTGSKPIPFQSGRPLWVKVKLTVNNGTGRAVTWYISNDDPWTAIDEVEWGDVWHEEIGAATTVAISDASMEIGGSNGMGSNDQMLGRVYCVEVRNGAGTAYASVDFRQDCWLLEPRTAYSFQSNYDRTGRLWSWTAGEIWADGFSPEVSYFTDRTNPTTVAVVPVGGQFDTTTTDLQDVTGLSRNVEAGTTYRFRASLDVAPDATGGHQYAIGGTATASHVYYWIKSQAEGGTELLAAREAALGDFSGESSSGATSAQTTIEGTLVVGAAGSLTVQFAQNTAAGTSSVLAGSTFEVTEIG